MSHAGRLNLTLGGVVFVAIALSGQTASTQSNTPPNPYRLVDNWAQLPSGMTWSGVISTDADAKGNIWVFHRSDPPILEFDSTGKLIKSFGTGMFVQAHGMSIDKDGNIWVTDAQTKDGKGDQVFKFSPDGKVLMTLGTAGIAGESGETFNGPADVVVAPNGDIYVADGHAAKATGRVVKFSKDGKFIKAWGKNGTGPGEFNTPHSIAIDSQGRIFVADRVNSRVQIFDKDGRFLDQWKQFGRPSAVFVDKNDTIYVADSQSNTAQNPGFARGIRIGNAKTGVVTAFIPDPGVDPDKNNNAGAEGVTSDAQGSVFAADVSGQTLRKYARK